MKYLGPLLVVKEIEKSKQFYLEVLGCEIISDFGANITLTGGFSLQTSESWQGFIHKSEADIAFGGNDAELYFEEDDLDGFMEKLGSFNVTLLHPLKEHPWGQRTVRFFDPDMHIIEVGENMVIVARRFINSGMTVEQTAKRMDVPVAYVQSLL